MPDPVIVAAESNRDFLERHARPGLIGLAGGDSPASKVINFAQRHLDDDGNWGKWSHAFFIQGVRPDGHQWVVESDLEVHRRHIRLGVQENRLSKYHDDEYYTRLALLDFHLTPEQHHAVVCRALDLVAERARYSLRELVGTALGLRYEKLRKRDNPFARSTSFFCSAFVTHLCRHAGLEVSESLPEKHVTPEDLFRSLAPHTTVIFERQRTNP